jgi:hypothetical protein
VDLTWFQLPRIIPWLTTPPYCASTLQIMVHRWQPHLRTLAYQPLNPPFPLFRSSNLPTRQQTHSHKYHPSSIIRSRRPYSFAIIFDSSKSTLTISMPSSYPAPAVTSLESGKRQPWKSMVGAYMPTVTTDFGKGMASILRPSSTF